VRAGTEALAHALRCLTDADADWAFDHVQRAAFLTKLANTPSRSALRPLVKMLYSTEPRFLWTDSDGATHGSYKERVASRGAR
jgi:hypothetical protein